jgi:chromosome segregation ATPase
LTALTTELVTVKARAEAQAAVQSEQAERSKRVEAELIQVRESAAAAREEAAQLRGQAEALKAQQAQLLEAITVRDGERPTPKGGKK